MERMKKWFSRWALALMATMMVLFSLTGCSSGDVSTAIDTAIEVLEVIEELESAAEAESKAEEQSEVQIESQTETENEIEQVPVVIEEDGHYISKEEVALYLHTYGKLPSNFITKKEAEELGWKKKDGEAGQLHVVAPGMSIGGSSFGNYEGLLPETKGRKYYECDINYVKGNRGAERLVYSNDGLIFYTGDHYESFEQLYP